MIDLDAIRARANAATPGPWNLYRYKTGGGRLCIDDAEQVGRRRALIADMIGDDPDAIATVYNEGDREFLLSVRADVPALLDHIDLVADQLNGLMDSLDDHVVADEEERMAVYESLVALWRLTKGLDRG